MRFITLSSAIVTGALNVFSTTGVFDSALGASTFGSTTSTLGVVVVPFVSGLPLIAVLDVL